MTRALLLSVHPKFADRIFQAKKTAEVRRVRPSVSPGDVLCFYVSSPEKLLRGCAVVDKVDMGDSESLWRKVNASTGMSRQEYEEYCRGARAAYAIHFSCVQELSLPVTLAHLKSLWKAFHPPQTYRYLSDREFRELQHFLASTGRDVISPATCDPQRPEN